MQFIGVAKHVIAEAHRLVRKMVRLKKFPLPKSQDLCQRVLQKGGTRGRVATENLTQETSNHYITENLWLSICLPHTRHRAADSEATTPLSGPSLDQRSRGS